MAGQRSTTLASLERGLQVLEYLAQRGEARLTDVAEHVQTSRTTAFRLVSSLQRHGLVEHQRASHTYRLGPGLPLLAARVESPRVVQHAHPAMAELRDLTGETINLVALRGTHLVYAAVLEGGYALRTLPRIGQTVAPHCSALGKAVLSRCSQKQRDLILGREPYTLYTDHTITRRQDLERELAEASQQGYAVDREETEIGLSCVAAPIFSAKDRLWGALSISGLTGRMIKWDWGELGERVQQLCDGISRAASEGQPAPQT